MKYGLIIVFQNVWNFPFRWSSVLLLDHFHRKLINDVN